MVSSPPIPSQRVRERTTEATAGIQISATWIVSGTPTIAARTPRSARPRRDRRTGTRRALDPPAGVVPVGAAGAVLAGAGGVVPVGEDMAASAREDHTLLLLDAAEQGIRLVGVVQELLEGWHHHSGREVRTGVAVHELGDVPGGRDQLRRLLLQRRVAARVGVRGGRDVVRVTLQVEDLRFAGGEKAQQVPGACVVARILAQQEAVDRGVQRVRPDGRIYLWEGEEVEILPGGRIELLSREHADHVHAGFLVRE